MTMHIKIDFISRAKAKVILMHWPTNLVFQYSQKKSLRTLNPLNGPHKSCQVHQKQNSTAIVLKGRNHVPPGRGVASK